MASWTVTSTTVLCVFIAFLGAVWIQLVKQSAIDPVPLLLPPPPVAEGPYAPNSILQLTEKVGDGLLRGAEDIAVDREGVIYTATRDGWVKRIWPNGSVEGFKYVGGNVLGLAIGNHGEVLVCETVKGLLNVTLDEVTVLSGEADGVKYKLTNAIAVASNGLIYFTDASSKYLLEEWPLDLLEARPHGRLLQYNPQSGTTSVLLSNLKFPNGVALSAKEDFAVVCETWTHRCLKYWLQGKDKGTTEIFIDNLPGAPDNIHQTGNGPFWIALLKLRSPILDIVYKHPFLKHIAGKPFIFSKINPVAMDAAVLKVGEDGQPIVRYQDPTGKRIAFLTSVHQIGDYLYFGNLATEFVGRLNLNKVA